MSENEKREQSENMIDDETKVMPLAQIDAQMKDAYKLLKEAKPQDKEAEPTVTEADANTAETKNDSAEAINTNDKQQEKQSKEADINEAKAPHTLTLEEKRRRQLENKMTIEERRRLQRENPKALERKSSLILYFQQADRIDYGFIILLITAELLNLYFTVQLMLFVSDITAMFIFILITALLIGCLFLTAKRRKLGFICSSISIILLLILSTIAYRGVCFLDKLTDNRESQTVMIVAKKDSELTDASDFNNKRLATVRYETKANELAEKLLTDKHKLGCLTQEYTSYQEAYNSLMSGKSDIMVYSPFIEQRLDENANHSEEHIKVLFERNQALTVTDAKKRDMKKEAFTVLISGINVNSSYTDERGNSDFNILATIHPKTKKMLIQMIPREIRVPLKCAENKHTKLACADGYGGTPCLADALEAYFGITIHYYIRANLNGIADTVDALGGITINNDAAFCTSYTDKNDVEQQICYPEGENDLNGLQALVYARFHQLFNDPKMKQDHQMTVINAILEEAEQSLSLGTKYHLFHTAEQNITTNFSSTQLLQFFKLLQYMNSQPKRISVYDIKGQIISHKDEITKESVNFFYPENGQKSLIKKRIEAFIKSK